MTTSARLPIYLMIGQAVLFSAETAIIHQIGAQVGTFQIAFLRGTAGVVLAIAICREAGTAALRTDQLALQLLRGLVSLLYLWVMIFSFSHLPFSDATAISYTQVIYITIFSVLILRESVSWSSWAAVGIGIFGALLIAQPAGSGSGMIYLVVLLGTGLNGLAFVLNRYLQRKDSAASTMLYTNIVMALGNLPALVSAQLPAIDLVPWCIGLALCGPVGMYLGIVALKRASAVSLGPYTLLRLVIGIVGSIILFQELPNALSACGALLIMVACIWSSCNEGGLEPIRKLLFPARHAPYRLGRLMRPQSNEERVGFRSVTP